MYEKIAVFTFLLLVLFNMVGCSNPDKPNTKEIKERVEKIQDLDQKTKNTTDLLSIDIYAKNMCISLDTISSAYSELSDKGKDEMSKYLELEISKETMEYMLEYIKNDTSVLEYKISDEIKNLSYQ